MAKGKTFLCGFPMLHSQAPIPVKITLEFSTSSACGYWKLEKRQPACRGILYHGLFSFWGLGAHETDSEGKLVGQGKSCCLGQTAPLKCWIWILWFVCVCATPFTKEFKALSKHHLSALWTVNVVFFSPVVWNFQCVAPDLSYAAFSQTHASSSFPLKGGCVRQT